MLGSSRMHDGFRPDQLPAYRLAEGEVPVVFNFGLDGHGPLFHLICLRRLLATGIRPHWLVVEFFPFQMLRDLPVEATVWVDRQGWRDLAVLRRYGTDPPGLYCRWGRTELVPWYTHRYCLLNRYLPTWIPWACRDDDSTRHIDRFGWNELAPLDPADYRRSLYHTRQLVADDLRREQIASLPDRAVRELLDLCRRREIAVVLVLMPEQRDIRSCYAPATWACIDSYLALVGQQYRVTVVDARNWIAHDGFCDALHLLPAGAAVFTERFGAEVLHALLEGKLLATSVTHSDEQPR